MNVSYMKTEDFDNPINNEKCPICGKDIYVSKYQTDFACSDADCPLGHGAKDLIHKIDTLLDMLKSE